MTFLTGILAIIYILINIVKLKDKKIIKQLAISIICILGISAFFWMPMIETYFFAEYTVYQENSMATLESFRNSGLEIKTLIFTGTDQDATHVFEIGIPILIMLTLSIVAIKIGINNKYKKEYIIFFILGIVCTIITIKQISWGIFENVFQIIQFKWRMLVFSNFFLSIICAINMGIIIKKFKLKDIIIITSIIIIYLGILIPMLPEDPNIEEINKYNIGELKENRNEAIAGMGKGEYLPVNSNDNREYIMSREKDTIEIITGNGIIEETNKIGKNLTCKIRVLENETILEFPYIYYPGYKITVNGKEIEGIEDEKGFLSICLQETDEVEIIIKYSETILMKLSKLISLLSILSVLGYELYIRKSKNKVS